MYQFFLCKANIIDWKVKPKSILFAPFFQENVRNCFTATAARHPLYPDESEYLLLSPA